MNADEVTYDDVVRHAFGIPRLAYPMFDQASVDYSRVSASAEYEGEHDWVLEMFATSRRLRNLAERVIARLDDTHAYAANRGSQPAMLARRRVNIAKALAGHDYNVNDVRYISVETVFDAFAALAEGTEPMIVDLKPLDARESIMLVLIELPSGQRKTVTALGRTPADAVRVAECEHDGRALSVHVEGWIDV
mgnify:CR=1 FL=1